MRNVVGSLTKTMPPGFLIAMRRQTSPADTHERRGNKCDPIDPIRTDRGGGESKPVPVSLVARGGTVEVDFGRARDTHPPFPRGRSTTSPGTQRLLATQASKLHRRSALAWPTAKSRKPPETLRADPRTIPMPSFPATVCKGMRKPPVGRQRTVGREYPARSRGDDTYYK